MPELLPFRLTPQLRGVLRPLDGVGLLRHYMVMCMQALRADATGGGTIGGSSTGNSSTTNSAGSKGKSKAVSPSANLPPASYSGIVPNALEVYVNDPVVDWLKGVASKTSKDKTAVSSGKASKATHTAEVS